MIEQCLTLIEKTDVGDMFTDSTRVVINGVSILNDIEKITCFFSNIRNGLSNINCTVKQVFYQSDKSVSFLWRINAQHSGVFMGILPTNKKIDFYGNVICDFSNEKISQMFLFYDVNAIEKQIYSITDNVLEKSVISNDLDGAAKNIYKLILSTRKQQTDTKQSLVNELRRNMMQAPDLSLLNKEKTQYLRNNTNVNREFVSINDRDIELFIYSPLNEVSNYELPTILYLHGGGWCIGSPEQYDMANRMLAHSTNSRVICPRYRLCPEHPYPAGFNDCCDVYLYCRKLPLNNHLFVNPHKIIVAGDSVGGGFAAALTLRMHDEQQLIPNALMLMSPATDMRLENYQSFNDLTKNNIMIDQGMIGFIRGCYIQGDMWDEPYVSPMRGDLSCFPPTFMMIGEADPLVDENIAFADKITASSQYKCNVVVGEDMPHHYHTFIGLAGAVDNAYDQMRIFMEGVS